MRRAASTILSRQVLVFRSLFRKFRSPHVIRDNRTARLSLFYTREIARCGRGSCDSCLSRNSSDAFGRTRRRNAVISNQLQQDNQCPFIFHFSIRRDLSAIRCCSSGTDAAQKYRGCYSRFPRIEQLLISVSIDVDRRAAVSQYSRVFVTADSRETEYAAGCGGKRQSW